MIKPGDGKPSAHEGQKANDSSPASLIITFIFVVFIWLLMTAVYTDYTVHKQLLELNYQLKDLERVSSELDALKEQVEQSPAGRAANPCLEHEMALSGMLDYFSKGKNRVWTETDREVWRRVRADLMDCYDVHGKSPRTRYKPRSAEDTTKKASPTRSPTHDPPRPWRDAGTGGSESDKDVE